MISFALDMLSKGKIKLVKSLSQKKFRDELKLFVAEGTKSVTDIAQHCKCVTLFATQSWLSAHEVKATEIIEVSETEIKSISAQKTPQPVVAIFEQPAFEIDYKEIENGLTLALDTVQDPGNLGTIIRLADWFGIRNIICSVGTADVFNPKTVQATMGAVGRVKIHYVDLPKFLSSIKDNIPVFGTFLDGENVYQKQLPKKGIVVMGNEGNGISSEVSKLITERLLIPNFSVGKETSESLNVAIATAIICSEFRR